MIPDHLSASSVETAEGCMARWAATHTAHLNSPKNEPAMLGTAIHAAIENYVREEWIRNKRHGAFVNLSLYYMKAFADAFGTSELTGEWYDDGLEQLTRWHARMPAVLPNVISLETKESFDIPTSVGPIPVVYIFDRLDYISGLDGNTDADEVNVVDYKTTRQPVYPEELAKKVQPRVYALAALHKYPKISKIWVTYDQTRHDVVSRSFSRDECRATWNFLIGVAERIIAADEGDPTESINAGCHYCVRKAVCATLKANVDAGSAEGLSQDDAIAMHWMLTNKIKAERALQDELSSAITAHMSEADETKLTAGDVSAKMVYSSRRQPDSRALIRIVGQELANEYGGFSITVNGVEQLLKSPEITEEQKMLIRETVLIRTFGNPSIRTSA